MAKEVANQQLYRTLAKRLNEEIPRPCLFWVLLDVRVSQTPPPGAPSVDVDHAVHTVLSWLERVDPERNLRGHPAFTGVWATGFAITVIALNRPSEAYGQPPVALPTGLPDLV